MNKQIPRNKKIEKLWWLFSRLDDEKEAESGFHHALILHNDGSGRVDYSAANLDWGTLDEGIKQLKAYLTIPDFIKRKDHLPF